MAQLEITRSRIETAERLIRPCIRRTPVISIDARELGLDAGPLALKLELMQHSGSFKCRGAFANLLMRSVPAPGVAAASGGNHGVAVAYAAMTLGVPARIFIPSVSSPAKIQRIRDYGAQLVLGDGLYAESLAASEAWVAETGALPVHAFDAPETLLGTGTLGLEFEQQQPALDTVLTSVGGGGLIGGVASWYAGRARVIGVEPETAPTLTRALEAGRPVEAPAGGVAMDSLAPRLVGRLMFGIAQRHVERVVLVEDDEIRAAQRTLWDKLRIVAEPGGVAALSALLARRYRPSAGERVGVVISGGNTIAVDFSR